MLIHLICNSGECRWEEPKGVPVLRASNPNITQWWELYVSFILIQLSIG